MEMRRCCAMSVELEIGRSELEDRSGVKMIQNDICVWEDLGVCDLERLEAAPDLRRALAEMLEMRHAEPRAAILLDLYEHTLRFCWESGFSRAQTSSVFSIVKRSHAACQGSPLMNLQECWSLFQELLLSHAVHRPPFSADLFTLQQIRVISHYFLSTYFQHFKLYKCVFTPQVTLDLTVSYTGSQDTDSTQEPGDYLPQRSRETSGESLRTGEGSGSERGDQEDNTPMR